MTGRGFEDEILAVAAAPRNIGASFTRSMPILSTKTCRAIGQRLFGEAGGHPAVNGRRTTSRPMSRTSRLFMKRFREMIGINPHHRVTRVVADQKI
jgi:hypothetical protein